MNSLKPATTNRSGPRSSQAYPHAPRRGLGHRDVVAAGEAWADLLLLPRRRTDVVAKLLAHYAAGDRVVLVSAGLDICIGPFAALLGVIEVMCYRLETDGSGFSAGEIIGETPAVHVKADLILDLLATGSKVVYNYGDDPIGDGAMLTMADHPVLVTGRGWRGGRESTAGLVL
jgi:phosphoserine phosphatase